MHSRNDLTGLGSHRRTLGRTGDLSVRFGQFFFFLTKEARVGYLLAIRQGGKFVKPYVKAPRLINFGQRAGVPLHTPA